METADEFIIRKSLEWQAQRERVLKFKDIGRQGSHDWVREAWTWHVQGNYPEKVLVIERLRHVGRSGQRGFEGGAETGDIEYVGRAAGRWVWGQFAPLIPQADLAELLDRAVTEGTLLELGWTPGGRE